MKTTPEHEALASSPARITLELLVSVAVGICITLLLGKDANWDTLNYHYYTAHAYLHIPLDSDFLGASTQRYLAPFGYLPFYWMTSAGWHSAVVGSVLGGLHGVALFFLWRICRWHVFASFGKHAAQCAAMACVLGLLSPVFLGIVGSTFIDPTANVFILAGVLFTMKFVDRSDRRYRLLLLAGLMFGIATALKLTSAIFGVSCAIACLLFCRGLKECAVTIAMLTLGGAFALLGIAGAWFHSLYVEFGNPVFPLLNHLFQSPDFSTDIATHTRFKVFTVAEALTLPFRMASVHSWIYVENAAPDLRFALTVLAGIACISRSLYLWASQRTQTKQQQLSEPSTVDPARTQPSSASAFLLIAFALMYLLWQLTSGNGRYALPVMVLVGPVLVILSLMVGLTPRTCLNTLIVVLAVQTFHVGWNGNPRWGTEPWKETWLDITTTPVLTDQPFGFLTVGIITHSASVIALHKDSRFLNLAGAHSIRADGPGSDRVKKFIAAHAPNLRVMFETIPGETKFGRVSSSVAHIDHLLSPWNLRVENGTCESLHINHLRPEGYELAACLVSPGNPNREAIERERDRVSGIMDKVEAACPLLFSPTNPLTTLKGGIWQREYVNNDIRMLMYRGKLYYSRYEYGPYDVPLGTEDEWLQGVGRLDCKMPARPFGF